MMIDITLCDSVLPHHAAILTKKYLNRKIPSVHRFKSLYNYNGCAITCYKNGIHINTIFSKGDVIKDITQLINTVFQGKTITIRGASPDVITHLENINVIVLG